MATVTDSVDLGEAAIADLRDGAWPLYSDPSNARTILDAARLRAGFAEEEAWSRVVRKALPSDRLSGPAGNLAAVGQELAEWVERHGYRGNLAKAKAAVHAAVTLLEGWKQGGTTDHAAAPTGNPPESRPGSQEAHPSASAGGPVAEQPRPEAAPLDLQARLKAGFKRLLGRGCKPPEYVARKNAKGKRRSFKRGDHVYPKRLADEVKCTPGAADRFLREWMQEQDSEMAARAALLKRRARTESSVAP